MDRRPSSGGMSKIDLLSARSACYLLVPKRCFLCIRYQHKQVGVIRERNAYWIGNYCSSVSLCQNITIPLYVDAGNGTKCKAKGMKQSAENPPILWRKGNLIGTSAFEHVYLGREKTQVIRNILNSFRMD